MSNFGGVIKLSDGRPITYFVVITEGYGKSLQYAFPTVDGKTLSPEDRQTIIDQIRTDFKKPDLSVYIGEDLQ